MFKGIENASNWFDSGVFSDLHKQVVATNETLNLNIDYDNYIEPTDEVLKDEFHKVVKTTKGHIELTRYNTEIIDGEEITTSETRYHEWVYYPADEVLANFEELWSNSWLWEECEVRGDIEVVINRKHWEIVLGKVKERITYEFEGELKEAVTWEHKYLPLYPYLSTQDLLDQFKQFWELEPYIMASYAVPAGDYEIAGQVLEDVIDLGVGYENFKKVTVGTASVTNGWSVDNTDRTNPKFIGTDATAKTTYRFNFIDFPECKIGDIFVITFEQDNINSINNSAWFTIEKISSGKFIMSIIGKSTNTSVNISTNFEIGNIYTLKNFQITKTSEPKPFIKNSRPDSKLALPQLSSLGSITSKEMRGNHLVAQHENGTAIIKNAVVNPNAPLSSLHWGIQAYRDENGNKRLFVSTADGTYPVGWENIKYDDEAVNTVFYDVARNSSSNNIAGLITEENGKLKVYIGEGYENYGKLNTGYNSDYCVWSDMNKEDGSAVATYGIDGKNTSYFQWLPSGGLGGIFIDGVTLTISITLDKFLPLEGKTILWGGNENLIKYENTVDGHKYTATFSYSSTQNSYPMILTMIPTSDFGVVKYKNIQITKTSTPKPFTEGIVPNGSLKVECDWTSENRSFVFKKMSYNSNPSYPSVYSCQNSVDVGTREYLQFVPSQLDTDSEVSAIISKEFMSGKQNDVNIPVSLLRVGQTDNIIKFSGFWNYNDQAEYVQQILIYNDQNLTQLQLEGELAKDIYLPTYHHQSNSVINTYGISGMGAMYLYSPALTDEEVDREVGKTIKLINPGHDYDIPDYTGN